VELKVARYKISRYIEPDEVLVSHLYGEDKYSLMFDLIELGNPRDEYRVSLGALANKFFWAAMWIDKLTCEIRLELTYLEQEDVELILQSVCNEFNVGLKLISNDNYMLVPTEFKPGEEVLREV
jgi:hypothetical protein